MTRISGCPVGFKETLAKGQRTYPGTGLPWIRTGYREINGAARTCLSTLESTMSRHFFDGEAWREWVLPRRRRVPNSHRKKKRAASVSGRAPCINRWECPIHEPEARSPVSQVPESHSRIAQRAQVSIGKKPLGWGGLLPRS